VKLLQECPAGHKNDHVCGMIRLGLTRRLTSADMADGPYTELCRKNVTPKLKSTDYVTEVTEAEWFERSFRSRSAGKKKREPRTPDSPAPGSNKPVIKLVTFSGDHVSGTQLERLEASKRGHLENVSEVVPAAAAAAAAPAAAAAAAPAPAAAAAPATQHPGAAYSGAQQSWTVPSGLLGVDPHTGTMPHMVPLAAAYGGQRIPQPVPLPLDYGQPPPPPPPAEGAEASQQPGQQLRLSAPVFQPPSSEQAQGQRGGPRRGRADSLRGSGSGSGSGSGDAMAIAGAALRRSGGMVVPQGPSSRCGAHFAFELWQRVEANPAGAPGAQAYWHEIMQFSEKYGRSDFFRNSLENVLDGLRLHVNIINAEEETVLMSHLYQIKQAGHDNRLLGATFSCPPPPAHVKGKKPPKSRNGRATANFGCCPPAPSGAAVPHAEGEHDGIQVEEHVQPLPPCLDQLAGLLVERGVLPAATRPDCCVVDYYEKGDWAEPRIDHHDFMRPFCVLRLEADEPVVFDQNPRPVVPDTKGRHPTPGEFEADFKVHVPRRSVLVLQGNSADLVKHCVPRVSKKMVSVTFRRMRPYFAQKIAHLGTCPWNAPNVSQQF